MERKVIELDIKSEKAVKGADNLNKSVTDLTAKFEDIYGEMQPLSGRMGELEDRMYELALAGKTNTQEFKDLQQEVGKMKKTIQEVDLIVDATAQTMSQKLGGSLEFASGAFTAVQGATAAFGVESAALEETLIKVQSAMAITQGISAMREGYKSVSVIMSSLGGALAKTALGQKALNIAQAAGAIGMKVLNAVMNLNPVFLLITGVTALAGAIAWLATEEANTAEESEKINDIYNERLAIMSKLEKNIKRDNAQALKELELKGASEKELHEQRKKNLDSEEKLRKAASIAEKENIESQRVKYKEALANEDYELAKTIREKLEKSYESYEVLQGQHKDYLNNKKNEDKVYENIVAAKAKEKEATDEADYKARVDKYKAFLQKKLQVENEIEDLRLGLIADGEFKEIEILNINAERKRQLVLKDTSISQQQREELIKTYELVRQAEEQKIRDSYFEKEKELAEKVAELKKIEVLPPPEPPTDDAVNVEVEGEEMRGALLLGIKEKWRKQDEESNKAHVLRIMAQADEQLEHMMTGLNALDELNSLLTDQAVARAGANEAAAEAARKKGFERSKKLQITMAVIQGVQGVMSAFTAGSSMGPAGVVMGPLMAALAAVTAGINIAKIKATTYQGGGGGAPSVPQSAPNPASFNVVGDSGTNQIAETLGQQNANPTKAYVVSGDVTTAQSLERNKIENATL
jgi:hypothetical protein